MSKQIYYGYWRANGVSTSGECSDTNLKRLKSTLYQTVRGHLFPGNTGAYGIYNTEDTGKAMPIYSQSIRRSYKN
jgi:hypothetical protein